VSKEGIESVLKRKYNDIDSTAGTLGRYQYVVVAVNSR
jgi:hypothetical protein